MDTHELDAISRPYFDRKEPVSHQSESKTEQYGLKKRVTKDMIKSKLWRGNDTHDEISTEDIELRNIESGQRIVTKDENDLDFFGAVGIAAIIGGVIFILRAFLQFYFFICIHSFYKKIIKGKKTSSATVTVERVTERVTVT